MPHFSTKNIDEILEWAEKHNVSVGSYVKKPIPILAFKMPMGFSIETLEGSVLSQAAGSYLAIGNHDDAYPIKGTIFEETYDRVADHYEVVEDLQAV